MHTARDAGRNWKAPVLFALGMSFVALLIAPLVIEPDASSTPASTELFSPYRERQVADAQIAGRDLLAGRQGEASTLATR